MLTSSVISFFVTRKFKKIKNQKNWWKLIKLANIDWEILHIFWTTWGTLITFSGKIWLMIILKVTKKQGFAVSLEDTFSEKS